MAHIVDFTIINRLFNKPNKPTNTMTKQEITENLNAQILLCKEIKDPMDSKSWAYEEGILITPNMAIEIVKLLNDINL